MSQASRSRTPALVRIFCTGLKAWCEFVIGTRRLTQRE